MKKWIITTLIIFGVTVAAVAVFWKPLLLKIGGFKTPEVETVASIASYGKEHNLKYDLLAVPKDSMAFKTLNKNFGIPGVIFYNKDLLPVKSSQGTGCPKTAHAFISDINNDTEHTVDSTGLTLTKLYAILNELNIVNGAKEAILQQIAASDFDYVVVYSWAKYLPKQSMQMAELGTEAKGIDKKNILVLSLNMDFVNTWYKQKKAPSFEF